MQKKLIALAVAGLASTAAFAQSNVTIYGVMDASQGFVKHSGGVAGNQSSVGRLDSNTSYIGFKGVEDLGNGLKAVFQYESNISADTAAAMSGGRDTFVGLTGGFGTVVAGNLTHPLRAMGARVELAPGATGFGTTMSVTGRFMGVDTGADNRAANAVAYVSPNFAGFTGTVAYVNGENKNNANVDQKAWQVAGQYENGPLWAALGYHKAIDTGVTGATAAGVPVLGADNLDTSIIRAAASYSFPTGTKLTALYDETRAEALGADRAKRAAWSLGVAQSFGKNTVGLEHGSAADARVGGTKLNNTGAKVTTLLYTYELSKRTLVQARYSRLSNEAEVNNNFYINPVSNGVAGSNGSDYTGYMVGLRHSF